MPSIKIVPFGGGAAFVPHVPGAQPGQHLEVDRGERVTWNNETNQPHWPWPIDVHDNFLSDEAALALGLRLTDNVAGGAVSHPIYPSNPTFSPPDVPPPSIRYACRHHPHERGGIDLRGE